MATRSIDFPARKRDSVATRARILDAAFNAFSRHGYATAGIREIADSAGVAASLVMRYFGSKAGLFESSLTNAIRENLVFTMPKAKFGAELARQMTEQQDTRLTAMTVLAISDPEAEQIVRRVVARDMIAPLAEWLGPPDAMGRATAMFALMTGFMMQVRLNWPATLPVTTTTWLGEAFQQIVDVGSPIPCITPTPSHSV